MQVSKFLMRIFLTHVPYNSNYTLVIYDNITVLTVDGLISVNFS